MNASLLVLGSIINVVTQNDLVYNFFPVTSGSFNFEVEASNDAHVALRTTVGGGQPTYEIVLGGWGNTKSEIRKYRIGVAESPTPDLLSQNESRGFWIRWEGGFISVGRRGQRNSFMSWNDSEPILIRHAGVSTGWGSTGIWVIEGGYRINTPVEHFYQYMPVPSGFVDFEFRGAHNAHVCLTSAGTESDPMYELILGGWNNTQSVIRYNRETPDMMVAVTRNLWSENEFRKFRIEWRNGTITARNQNTGRIILYWEDPNPFTVTHFGVRSGWGAQGHWRIYSA